MSRYTFHAQIDAPPESVYDLWTNLDRVGEWVEGVTRVTDVRGPYGETGSTYTQWFGRLASPSEIVLGERPHRLVTRFANRVLRGRTEVTFEAHGSGTAMTQVYDVEGLVPRLAARVFAIGSYRGSFQGELNTFVRLAEREAHA